MTFQEKGQVLFLEVAVLFSFLLSFVAVSSLIGAILRLHKYACSIIVLGVYHTIITTAEPLDTGVLLTLYQCETTGALAHLPHPGRSGEEQLETRSPLHDQLRNKRHGLHLLQPVI